MLHLRPITPAGMPLAWKESSPVLSIDPTVEPRIGLWRNGRSASALAAQLAISHRLETRLA
jgi:hypothetical protein